MAVSGGLLAGLSGVSRSAAAQTAVPNATPARPGLSSATGTEVATGFDAAADAALVAMRKRAAELGVGGVAVVAYFEGESVASWSSKMAVVGRMKDSPSQADKGSNLIAIAYSKAAEMADTLKNSGSHVRPPMTGEFGWNGGVIRRGQHGYLIAAFSGGKSEDDVSVSTSGVTALAGVL